MCWRETDRQTKADKKTESGGSDGSWGAQTGVLSVSLKTGQPPVDGGARHQRASR